ncbi:hypothetical protein HOK68_01590 [Candidatus Woesearchaeota archaeon]|jgi:tRNA threonylcarbamoyladenosine modification (KEOPS) complex  Pcc1 subunit|nr:hypothetical protein [Candidatus Woesearchaeota archaeon]MBT4387155.1 hypothetical protein [Candidatus Woesearchaeota archaeon]MBT4596088.1 hypothetical protein [Candidatus Woesearchaeota archaeon]MBT5741690.1 hypothetical protein [Candidatus Woesearchaeota archaeon]MBT6505453.1 hypothetical protein [Candidatus Woesearchaeota archaeon]
MKYKVNLIIPFAIKNIIEPEILDYKKNFKRVEVNFLKEDPLEIEIKASDSVSLRAVLNTISKLCTIYEKSLDLVNKNE